MYHIATLTVAEFKNLKRAIRVLVNAGIPFEEACNILIQVKEQRDIRRVK